MNNPMQADCTRVIPNLSVQFQQTGEVALKYQDLHTAETLNPLVDTLVHVTRSFATPPLSKRNSAENNLKMV